MRSPRVTSAPMTTESPVTIRALAKTASSVIHYSSRASPAPVTSKPGAVPDTQGQTPAQGACTLLPLGRPVRAQLAPGAAELIVEKLDGSPTA